MGCLMARLHVKLLHDSRRPWLQEGRCESGTAAPLWPIEVRHGWNSSMTKAKGL